MPDALGLVSGYANLVEQRNEPSASELVWPRAPNTRRGLVALLRANNYALTLDRQHLVLAVSDATQATVLLNALRSLRVTSLALFACAYPDSALVFVAHPQSSVSGQMNAWLQQALLLPIANDLTVGVSLRIDRATHLLDGVKQATEALALARQLGRSGTFYYQALGLERLLGSLREHEGLQRFYHDLLSRLERYDAAHQSDLMRTLEAFFACNANSLQAARALAVHRNTMSNRLQRISEILQLDLAHPEARLSLQVALKIRRLCRGVQSAQ